MGASSTAPGAQMDAARTQGRPASVGPGCLAGSGPRLVPAPSQPLCTRDLSPWSLLALPQVWPHFPSVWTQAPLSTARPRVREPLESGRLSPSLHRAPSPGWGSSRLRIWACPLQLDFREALVPWVLDYGRGGRGGSPSWSPHLTSGCGHGWGCSPRPGDPATTGGPRAPVGGGSTPQPPEKVPANYISAAQIMFPLKV